jgi:MerR family redox-sensitive transcriptional activator SoxR
MVTAASSLRGPVDTGRPQLSKNDVITIGQLSTRTGVSVSALRFYEERGLLQTDRSESNQRRFLRSDIRRVSFILIAQRLGLSLDEIEEQLAHLPKGQTPSMFDWRHVSQRMRSTIDERIKLLTRARARLDECIGCGCMSLNKCELYNKEDRIGAAGGTGPKLLLD